MSKLEEWDKPENFRLLGGVFRPKSVDHHLHGIRESYGPEEKENTRKGKPPHRAVLSGPSARETGGHGIEKPKQGNKK